MTVYTIDADNDKVVSHTYIDVANLLAFYNEMDEVHREGWYTEEDDAYDVLYEMIENEEHFSAV
jgi:hypothetical protein